MIQKVLIVYLTGLLANAAAQQIFTFPPFQSTPDSPDSERFHTVAMAVNEAGDDSSILFRSRPDNGPRLFLSVDDSSLIPVPNSENYLESTRPVAFANNEATQVFFTSSDPNGRILNLVELNNQGICTGKREVFPASNFRGREVIARSSTGDFRVAYSLNSNPKSFQIFRANLEETFNGTTFRSQFPGGGITGPLGLSIDSTDVCHIFYSSRSRDSDTGIFTHQLHHETSSVAGGLEPFSSPIRVLQSNNFRNQVQQIASAIDSEDKPFIIFRDTVSEAIILGELDSATWSFYETPLRRTLSEDLDPYFAYLGPRETPTFLIPKDPFSYDLITLNGGSVSSTRELNQSVGAVAIGPQDTPRFSTTVLSSSFGGNSYISRRSRFLDDTDLDGDGQSFLMEEALGSAPNDATDYETPRALIVNNTSGSIISNTADGYSLIAPATWANTNLGIRLEVELSRDLETWVRRPTNIDSRTRFFFGQSTIQVVNDDPTTSEDAYPFFRLRVTRDE